MEKLARALSVIQQGMLRNNPGHVKDSVNEATEVLSGMLNTHKCLLESRVEIQKRKSLTRRRPSARMEGVDSSRNGRRDGVVTNPGDGHTV